MQLATLSMFLKISQIIWFLRSEDDDAPSLSHLSEEVTAFLSLSPFLSFSSSPSSFFSAANLIVLCLVLECNKNVINHHIQK